MEGTDRLALGELNAGQLGIEGTDRLALCELSGRQGADRHLASFLHPSFKYQSIHFKSGRTYYYE